MAAVDSTNAKLKISEYLSQIEELLRLDYRRGTQRKDEVKGEIKALIRGTFDDAEEKLKANPLTYFDTGQLGVSEEDFYKEQYEYELGSMYQLLKKCDQELARFRGE